MANQENLDSSSSSVGASRSTNIQKINDRKQKIFNLQKSSKIFKISTYSSCQSIQNVINAHLPAN